jgi:uncharacterized membrane protein
MRGIAALMIVVGLLILLFCVPYWFWAAVLGLALTILGVICGTCDPRSFPDT